jgi:hypothetical protein
LIFTSLLKIDGFVNPAKRDLVARHSFIQIQV